MGDVQRIMYFHVASAWVAFLAFAVTFFSSIWYLIKRDFRWDRIAVSSAELGLIFTTFVLITGPLWAKPVWNTWWTWDPRLTTTLILWFLYIAYLLLRRSISDRFQKSKISAVFGIVAFIDVPIIHLSVTWWRSIHPDVINDTGFHMPPSMVLTLMFSFLVYTSLFGLLLWIRTSLESDQEKLREIRNRIESL